MNQTSRRQNQSGFSAFINNELVSSVKRTEEEWGTQSFHQFERLQSSFMSCVQTVSAYMLKIEKLRLTRGVSV